jgi:hypothetical protein
MFLRAVNCALKPTKHYLIVQRGRMEGFIVLDYMSRAAEAIGALAGIPAHMNLTREAPYL